MTLNNIKFLKFWWEPNSIVDPNNATEDYFKVTYDGQGRYIWVERYSILHQLLSRDRFIWNEELISKVELFNAKTNSLDKYIVFLYDKNGEVKGRDHYSPNGELLRHETM